jgi:hypothetical protein
VLARFSTPVPPQLVERSRADAPQLDLRRREIAAAAIERFLGEDGS